MRANSPTDSGFSVLNPVEDEPNTEPTQQMKQLAKAAKSPDGKIILDHLQDKIDEYTSKLRNTDLSQTPNETVALATIMGYQWMVKEFETVLSDVKLSTQVVANAARPNVQR